MSLRTLQGWAFLAAILVGVGVAAAIGISIIRHGATLGLGLALAAVLGFFLTLAHPTR
jgi:hypothetical protein